MEDRKEFIKLKDNIKNLFNEGLDEYTIIETLINDGIEFWNPVKDLEDLYSFSNLGRVRSNRTGKILKPTGNWFEDWDGDWCKCYGLSKNGKRINFYVKDPFISES
jgi:hypothetical protein